MDFKKYFFLYSFNIGIPSPLTPLSPVYGSKEKTTDIIARTRKQIEYIPRVGRNGNGIEEKEKRKKVL